MDRSTGFIYRNDGDMRSHEFFLYSLVRGIQPKRILEIGVRAGVSTFAMTQAVSDGKIPCDYHVCDLDPACLALNPQLPIKVDWHIQSSDELAIMWRDAKASIDLLLVDGCHEISQVKKDFENYYPYVSKGGFILFHDTCPPAEWAKASDACWSAYLILPELKKYVIKDEIEMVTLPYSYGLTIVRKL